MAAVLLLGLISVADQAAAVHDEAFQLDGDVASNTTTQVPANSGNIQTVDWDSLFNADGTTKAAASLPADFGPAKLTSDFSTKPGKKGTTVFDTSDGSTYTTGSKDTLGIATGWQCASSNNVLSKDDIMNTYATAYKDPVTGDPILYFGLERNSNNGDANVAFWFLQGEVACDSTNGTASFTGHHVDGDILIVSAFTSGGRVSNINAYRWTGDDSGSLNTTPSAIGGDCRPSADNSVPGAPSGDIICATANDTRDGSQGTITTPWLTANATDNVGHTLRTSDFFEGGINLRKANLAGKCFNKFIGDTRSSQSLTATIFDFAEGTLGECSSTTVTTPTPAHTGSTTIGANGTVTTSDSAALNVKGVDAFNGTLSFFLCGPFAANATTTCDSGGVASGSSTVTTNGNYTSTTRTITRVGRYCWRAEFSGDDSIGVPPSSDHSDAECFLVVPRQPTLSTQAGSSPVDFGSAVTDTATLGNTANRPGTNGLGADGSIDATNGGAAGGTITFTLYKDDCTTLATSTKVGDVNPQTRSVSGNGVYPTASQSAVSFTPDAPGTYHWVATYSGDSPNTLASLPSQSPCPDATETVVVQQIPTSITTKQFIYPNDTATITSSAAGNNLGAGGSVVFKLYQAAGGNTAAANCAANGATGFLYTETKTLAGGAHSEQVSTSNTSVSVNASGSYYWRVTYTPAAGDTAHLGTSSVCIENTAVTFNNDPAGT